MRGKNQFSKITALIKDKDRRAKKEQPDGADNVVAYVDSARAALTASLGAKDLRGDILKHRHRLKDQEDTDDTESPGFLLLIEQAEWDLNVSYYILDYLPIDFQFYCCSKVEAFHLQIHSPYTAVKYLNKAAAIVPDDVYVLTLRAHAKLGCQDYEGALMDANKVRVFVDINSGNIHRHIFDVV